MKSLSRDRLLATPWTAAYQAPPPWDFPGKSAGVGCHFLLQCMKVESESEVAQSCLTLCDPMDCSLSLLHPWDFPGKSGVPLPSLPKRLHRPYLYASNFHLFPVVMYGCESWTIKKAEHQRIDAFELWCLRRLLRVPWTARRSNQSILEEISRGVHWKDRC